MQQEDKPIMQKKKEDKESLSKQSKSIDTTFITNEPSEDNISLKITF